MQIRLIQLYRAYVRVYTMQGHAYIKVCRIMKIIGYTRTNRKKKRIFDCINFRYISFIHSYLIIINLFHNYTRFIRVYPSLLFPTLEPSSTHRNIFHTLSSRETREIKSAIFSLSQLLRRKFFSSSPHTDTRGRSLKGASAATLPDMCALSFSLLLFRKCTVSHLARALGKYNAERNARLRDFSISAAMVLELAESLRPASARLLTCEEKRGNYISKDGFLGWCVFKRFFSMAWKWL